MGDEPLEVLNMTEAIDKTVAYWMEHEDQTGATRTTWLPECPKCGSTSGQWRGYVETKKVVHHRRWCKTCGKWFYKNHTSIKPMVKERVSNNQLREEEMRFDAWIEAYEEALNRGDAL